MSAERFDVRRGLVVEAANAIEKAYSYARLLPEPTAQKFVLFSVSTSISRWRPFFIL